MSIEARPLFDRNELDDAPRSDRRVSPAFSAMLALAAVGVGAPGGVAPVAIGAVNGGYLASLEEQAAACLPQALVRQNPAGCNTGGCSTLPQQDTVYGTNTGAIADAASADIEIALLAPFKPESVFIRTADDEAGFKVTQVKYALAPQLTAAELDSFPFQYLPDSGFPGWRKSGPWLTLNQKITVTVKNKSGAAMAAGSVSVTVYGFSQGPNA